MSKEHVCHFFNVFFLIPALQSLWGQGDYKEEMDEMLAEQLAIEAAPPKSPLQLLRDRSVRWQLMSMSIIYCCNQLSGMSAVRMEMLPLYTNFSIQTMKIIASKNQTIASLLLRSVPSLLTSS